MGSGSFTSSDWSSYSRTTKSSTRAQIFKQSRIHQTFDPNGISIRESRDSVEHPKSTAIILGLDVTGSMGMIAEHIAKESLGSLMLGIYENQPVTDPQICVMGIGDVTCDEAPLQVSQFESDIRIGQQLTDLWLEGRGGGNDFESYNLPWYFAAFHTSIDCFEKREKKGYLFTFGDEMVPEALTPSHINKVFGYSSQKTHSSSELYNLASEKFDVFHIIVEQGNYARSAWERVKKDWRELMGYHAVLLDNYNYLSEVILSVIRVNEGENAEDVVNSWQDVSIRKTVRRALFD